MKPTRNSGFTLIEVLISFVILALVLGVVFRSLSTGLSHERTAELATARVLEARSILDRLGADLPLEEGQAEGELATGPEGLGLLPRPGHFVPDAEPYQHPAALLLPIEIDDRREIQRRTTDLVAFAGKIET